MEVKTDLNLLDTDLTALTLVSLNQYALIIQLLNEQVNKKTKILKNPQNFLYT